MYGFVGVVYGHGPPTPPLLPDPDKLEPIVPGNIVVLILAATDDDAELKQLIEFWWWFDDTTEPKGLTGHGNVFVPFGDKWLIRDIEFEVIKVSFIFNFNFFQIFNIILMSYLMEMEP